MSDPSVLSMWTVYDHPRDFPVGFVARRWIIDRAGPRMTDDVVTAPTLEGVRNKLPPGLYRLPRFPEDSRVVVESWL